MHIHISVMNNKGENVLADANGDDSMLLKRALAGMIDLMPASMALLAPNVNSYRRFQPGMYVPTQASSGHNNRTVALRIPCGDRDNHRVEYRVAGADANPYLVMSTIWRGSFTVWITICRCRKRWKATDWSRKGYRFLSARAMRCGSLCKTTVCVNYWVSVLATCITPVKTMN